MIRLFTSILIALFVTTSAVVSFSNVLELKNNCCIEVIKNQAATLQSDCLCCLPAPSRKLPNKTVQIQIKTVNNDLQASALRILTNNKQVKIRVSIDRRRPLHLASNELYLKKRALLI